MTSSHFFFARRVTYPHMGGVLQASGVVDFSAFGFDNVWAGGLWVDSSGHVTDFTIWGLHIGPSYGGGYVVLANSGC